MSGPKLNLDVPFEAAGSVRTTLTWIYIEEFSGHTNHLVLEGRLEKGHAVLLVRRACFLD